MSKLSELIAALCPDGVEYKKLSTLGTLTRGKRFTKRDFVPSGIPAIHYGELYTHYGISTTSAKTNITNEIGSKMRFAQPNDVIIVGAGETVEDIGIGLAWLGDEAVAVHDACYILHHNLNPKYISYYLRTPQYHEQIKRYVSTGKISSISAEGIGKASIPIPPLEVQREIVCILDNFAEMTKDLSEKLNAELIARKKQYEYYRDLLLTFDDAGCPLGGGTHRSSSKHTIRWAKLGDEFPLIRNGFVGTVTPYFTDKEHGIRYLRGTNIHDGMISDNDVCYVNKDFNKKHCQTILKADDILVVQSGHVGECAVVGKQYEGANCHALIVMSNGGTCDSKYISYYLQSKEGKRKLNRITTGGTVKHILASQIKKVVVPVPPLSEQRRIISILDRFDALCHDICADLPAEIAARRKQYEYYRDKLLTFEEKTA